MSEMTWYYARGGQQLGPVTLDALRGQAGSGELQGEDLVWREGMADWVEARRVPEVADALAAKPDEGAYDFSPGQAPPAPAPYAAPYGAAPYPGVAQPGGVLSYGTYQTQPWSQQVNYAGFWIRVVATIIDGLITAVPNVIIEFVVGLTAAQVPPTPTGQPAPAAIGITLMSSAISIVIGWLYEALFTASRYQATPGKMAVGIKVIDLEGNRISFARATGRHFAKIISGIICGFGYFMAGWDARKRALHDQIASTYVVYK